MSARTLHPKPDMTFVYLHYKRNYKDPIFVRYEAKIIRNVHVTYESVKVIVFLLLGEADNEEWRSTVLFLLLNILEMR